MALLQGSDKTFRMRTTIPVTSESEDIVSISVLVHISKYQHVLARTKSEHLNSVTPELES